jgi:polyphosphate kinase 2 (PPK2 family)
VTTELLAAIRRGLERSARPAARGSSRDRQKTKKGSQVTTLLQVEQQYNVLDNLDLTQKLSDDEFDKVLPKQQSHLNMLQRRAGTRGVSTIIVFEGWDAAGKGGAIRRVTASLDARDYQVIPIAAPTDEERAHHYLWRFWRHLSRAGRLSIFDRSWYGRVLVERVEGFATEAEWMRAYGEINHFEEQLVSNGILLIKFWIHISKDEQLARFRHRSRTSYKRWKITDEDWRNRKRWPQYTAAVDEMVARTSTKIAPWTLVEGNDKNFARVKVLKTLADRLEHRLKR